MTNQPQVVTLDKLAKRLRLSKRWLRTEAIAGRIPSLRIGSRRIFNPDAVEAAIAERAADPDADCNRWGVQP